MISANIRGLNILTFMLPLTEKQISSTRNLTWSVIEPNHVPRETDVLSLFHNDVENRNRTPRFVVKNVNINQATWMVIIRFEKYITIAWAIGILSVGRQVELSMRLGVNCSVYVTDFINIIFIRCNFLTESCQIKFS